MPDGRFSGSLSDMSALLLPESYLTVEEYLAREERSDVKHEHLGGDVYAMSGASTSHNRIAMNLYGMSRHQLRGKRCEMFGSDMKLRLSMNAPDSTYFYYPDAMIVCDQKGSARYGWRERPAAIFEIISESTRHVEEREKKLAYLQLPSLEAYVRIEQERPEAVVEMRTLEGWKRERIIGLEGIIRLPTLGVELPLAELHERVIFGSEESV